MCAREGKPLPRSIRDAPRLHASLAPYFRAFLELGTCRNIGMAEGPIPWTAVLAWMDEHGIEGGERYDFENIIRLTDDAYLKWKVNKRKRDMPPAPGQGPQQGVVPPRRKRS